MITYRDFILGFFSSPRVHFILDGQFGSSGKGKLAYWLSKGIGGGIFSCTASSPNAGHTVIDDGKEYFLQQLTTQAILPEKKIFLGPGSVIDVDILMNEITRHNISPDQLSIDPMAMIIGEEDIVAEGGRGISNISDVSNCMKIGSTLHGCGKARIRKIDRGEEVNLARDVDVIRDYVSENPVRYDIVRRSLKENMPGICEISQGFGLGIDEKHYPRVTSRNCTVQQSLDGMGIPPYLVGNVIINLRTYPIRVNSNKYVDKHTGEILVDDDIKRLGDDQYITIEGNSGDFYEDSEEYTWEELGIVGPSGELVREKTSVSQLIRRVASFSKKNLIEAILSNLPPDPFRVYLSLNFVNYLDQKFYGVSDKDEFLKILKSNPKVCKWMRDNIVDPLESGDLPKHKIGKEMLMGTAGNNKGMVVVNIEDLAM